MAIHGVAGYALSLTATKDMTNGKSCCFISGRTALLPDNEHERQLFTLRLRSILRRNIIRLIEDEGVTVFFSGVLPGTDLNGAEIVLELKERFPQIQLICVLACEQLADGWDESLRERFFDVLEFCDSELYINKRFTDNCLAMKNEFLASRCDFVITNADEEKNYCIYSSPFVRCSEGT